VQLVFVFTHTHNVEKMENVDPREVSDKSAKFVTNDPLKKVIIGSLLRECILHELANIVYSFLAHGGCLLVLGGETWVSPLLPQALNGEILDLSSRNNKWISRSNLQVFSSVDQFDHTTPKLLPHYKNDNIIYVISDPSIMELTLDSLNGQEPKIIYKFPFEPLFGFGCAWIKYGKSNGLLVFGGHTTSNITSLRMYLWTNYKKPVWKILPWTLPDALSYSGVCFHKNMIWICGGRTTSGVTNDCYAMEIVGTGIKSLSKIIHPMSKGPHVLAMTQTVLCRNQLVLVGYDDKTVDVRKGRTFTLQVMNADMTDYVFDQEWKELQGFTTPKILYHEIVSIENRYIVILAGEDATHPRNAPPAPKSHVYRLDLDNLQLGWTSLAHLNTPRMFSAALYLPNLEQV